MGDVTVSIAGTEAIATVTTGGGRNYDKDGGRNCDGDNRNGVDWSSYGEREANGDEDRGRNRDGDNGDYR